METDDISQNPCCGYLSVILCYCNVHCGSSSALSCGVYKVNTSWRCHSWLQLKTTAHVQWKTVTYWQLTIVYSCHQRLSGNGTLCHSSSGSVDYFCA